MNQQNQKARKVISELQSKQLYLSMEVFKKKYSLNPEEIEYIKNDHRCVTVSEDKLGLCVEPDLSFSFNTISEQRGNYNDRFIPNRRSERMKNYMDEIPNENENRNKSPENIAQLYKSQVLKLSTLKNFEYGQSSTLERGFEVGKYIKQFNKMTNDDSKKIRKIQKAPYKVLDAPALQDDFYLNLIDWSQQNILAVGLGSAVYLWAPETGKVTKLCDLSLLDSISSLVWLKKSQYLAIGTNLGELNIWDVNKICKVRTFGGHLERIGSLAECGNLLTSGSKDKSILTRDHRSPANYTWKLTGHRQEICGLKWSFDEQQLASGGNDNKLILWSPHSTNPIYKFRNHTAAVKALAWSPHQHGLLASGGGTADKTIRFWNSLQGKQLKVVDTGSQVCNLMFSKTVNQIVSTHGYSQNHITIWKYPDMEKITSLSGHSLRVLYLAMSPDGSTIVTGAGDETLRFWNVFPGKSTNNESQWATQSKLQEEQFNLR